MIYSILCVDKNYGIGKNNDLLFRLPKDMAFFKEKTLGHMVFLGENTFLSFPHQKPLKDRINVVLSKGVHDYPNVINIHDFNEFISLLREKGKDEDVFVIGGASIYHQTLPYVDYVYLTKVDADGEATVFFDNLDKLDNFECIEKSEPVMDGIYPIRFCLYKRLK